LHAIARKDIAMRFLTYDALKENGINYSKPHLWRLIKAGRFPAPVKGLAAENVWPEAEIDSIVAERVAARDAANAPEAA
jgi:prophage regulatory protein